MEYEWDEAKRQANLVKHEVDFRVAALIFEGLSWKSRTTDEITVKIGFWPLAVLAISASS